MVFGHKNVYVDRRNSEAVLRRYMRVVHAVGSGLRTVVWHVSQLRERSADTPEVLRVLRGYHRGGGS